MRKEIKRKEKGEKIREEQKKSKKVEVNNNRKKKVAPAPLQVG